jgi:hypothetical protein
MIFAKSQEHMVFLRILADVSTVGFAWKYILIAKNDCKQIVRSLEGCGLWIK